MVSASLTFKPPPLWGQWTRRGRRGARAPSLFLLSLPSCGGGGPGGVGGGSFLHRIPPRRRVTFWAARKSPKSRQGVAAIGRPRLSPCHPPPGPLFTGVIPFDLRHNRREEICVAGPVSLRARGPGERKISVCTPLRARLVLGSQLTKQKPAPAVLAAKTRRRCGIAEAAILGRRGPQARGNCCQRADFSRRLCWTHKRRTPP